MKKYYFRISLTVITGLSMLNAVSQTIAPYIFFKPIYGFTASPVKINETTAELRGQAYNTGVYGSYGRGLSVSGGVGKMLNNTFGVELGAEYIFGKKVYSSVYTDSGYLGGNATDRMNALLFKPVIVLRNSGDLLTIYSKLGLAICASSRRYEDLSGFLDVDTISIYGSADAVENVKIKVGYTASFGLSFRVSENMSIFTEITGQLLSLNVYKGHYNHFYVNGMDVLSTFPTRDKQWVYQKNNVPDPSNEIPQDPDKPEVRLLEPANFSYIGISIGFNYYF